MREKKGGLGVVVLVLVVACVRPLQGATLTRRAVPVPVLAAARADGLDLERALHAGHVVHTRFDPTVTHVVQSGRHFRGLGVNGCGDGALYESSSVFGLRAGHQMLQFTALDTPLGVGLPPELRGKAVLHDARLDVLVATNADVFAAAFPGSPFSHIPEWDAHKGALKLYVCLEPAHAPPHALEQHTTGDHEPSGVVVGPGGGVVVGRVFPGWRASSAVDGGALGAPYAWPLLGEGSEQRLEESANQQQPKSKTTTPHMAHHANERSHVQHHRTMGHASKHHRASEAGAGKAGGHTAGQGGHGAKKEAKTNEGLGGEDKGEDKNKDSAGEDNAGDEDKDKADENKDKEDNENKDKEDKEDKDGEGDKDKDSDDESHGNDEHGHESDFCKKYPDHKDCLPTPPRDTPTTHRTKKSKVKAKAAPVDARRTAARAKEARGGAHGTAGAVGSSHAKRVARAATLEETATPRATEHAHSHRASHAHARSPTHSSGVVASTGKELPPRVAAAKAKEEELDRLLADLA